MSSPPIPIVLKRDSWPEDDRRLWGAACAGGGFFDDGGRFASHSNGTLRLREQCYGQWVSFLARTRPSELAKSPVARVTQENVEAFVEESRLRLKNRSIENLLLSILLVAKAFDPHVELNWLSGAVRRMHRLAREAALRPPLPISAGELWNWSQSALAMSEKEQRGHPVTRAVKHRQALMIGAMIAFPQRLRAIVSMTIAEHVSFVGDRIELRFQPQNTKTKTHASALLPVELVAPMRAWLDHHRPVLLRGRTSEALWITRDGTDMSADTLQGGLAVLTEREFGVRLRPHAFRHIAATSIAEEDPAKAGTIRDILGHATLRTSEMHYNRATSSAALTNLQAIQSQCRKAARKRRKTWRGEG